MLQGTRERCCAHIGQHHSQRGSTHTGHIGRCNTEIHQSRPSRKKISYGLHRRTIVAPACAKSTRFKFPLEANAAKHTAAEIDRIDLNEQCAVRCPRAAAVVAHPVRHETSCLRGCRDHHAARAHTKGVDPASALLIPIGQCIIRSRKIRTARCRAVLHTVNEFLRMLNAHAYGEWLCLHPYACLMQHGISIARRVPNAEKHCARRNDSISIDDERSDAPRIQCNICYLCAEAHLAAHSDDALTQMLYDRAQHIRPDMRLLKIPYLLGSTRSNKRLDDLSHPRVTIACCQFSIGKRPCPALTKLYIRCGIELSCLPEACDIPHTVIHIPPTFEHERGSAGTGKQPRGKNPRRTKSYNNGTLATALRRIRRNSEGLRLLRPLHIPITAHPHEDSARSLHLDVNRIVPPYGRTVPAPCIQSLMNDNHPVHCTG